jgi:rhamnosyltransferase
MSLKNLIIVPTLNAAGDWPRFAPALLACAQPDEVLIIDSSSSDGTAELARTAGFRVHSIARADFSHGGTRQLGVELGSRADLLVYLTQDAVLASRDALANLLRCFEDERVAAAFGRQLPRPEAGPIEAHARLFNYPSDGGVRTLGSRKELGIKTIFISNSFAAYRRSALLAIGGFPSNVIFGEDTIAAAQLLLQGGHIAYTADAAVYHSHAYSCTQDFRRYFDIGVLHARERWLLREFGEIGGEGKRFVYSEISHLARNGLALIPSAVLRTGLKFLGYKLGRMESKLPLGWKNKFSMHRTFWKKHSE